MKAAVMGVMIVIAIVGTLAILVDFGGNKASTAQADETQFALRYVIGHRGSCADRPENTLVGIRRAIEAGATGVEIDVRTTSDGHLVLKHDAGLERTTDGSGTVNERTLAEIKSLDAGSWFDPAYRGERIPTLAEALAVCREHGVDVLLDLKEQGQDYAEAVTAVVKASGDPALTIVGVRTQEQALLFRQLLPESRQLGFIRRPDDIESFVEAGVEMIRIWPKWLENDDSAVQRVRQAGVDLHLNAVTGDIDEVRMLMSYDPESILCDDPAGMFEILAMLRREKNEALTPKN